MIEVFTSIRFVPALVESSHSRVIRPESERRIKRQLSFQAVDVHVVVQVVAQMDVECVLLVERDPVAHFDQELRWIIVATSIEL